jgi:hypothetical protein
MARRLNTKSDSIVGHAGASLTDASLVDFWEWAFSDLCDDGLKGIFAEWLVHKLLGIQSARRIYWSNSDLLTPEGVGMEVKATAFWQSWKLLDGTGTPYPQPIYSKRLDERRIRFAGLMARDSTSVPDISKPPALKSQIYVFAFQNEKDLERWNAMDLSQWEFCVVLAEELAKIGDALSPSTGFARVRTS